ncbi:acyl carrier protein 1, chloroplastic-like [Cornus florida]|uniref:acyl carrier protein 1, chloroplastic-like n=1 Tax=Cornus florida TaxID=4283 RepID=UPI00289D48F1|nr:acyl carrier protein 1, chloroplastic-like [Cornus florida]
MAAIAGSSLSLQFRPRLSHHSLATNRISCLKSVSISNKGRSLLSLRLQPLQSRFCVSCAAKPETVKTVCKIVEKQLALRMGYVVMAESKFVAFGADSLDAVTNENLGIFHICC